MSKTTKVVPIQPDASQPDKPRLIASDEKTQRFILGIGSERVAFDFTSRVTKLPPKTGDKPAEVIGLKKDSKPKPNRRRG